MGWAVVEDGHPGGRSRSEEERSEMAFESFNGAVKGSRLGLECRGPFPSSLQ